MGESSRKKDEERLGDRQAANETKREEKKRKEGSG